ncbi:Stf0 family sulfotransferase [Capilliphycus salinus ALCB114379]|uniref:Stf0 family sulfotransferase n=1 Tax=Capilliphycus salinus TaxID=2768948 RepID=UPI0039A7597A
MDKKTYVICTTARSGSNLLCDLLASSKMMGNPKEVLNVDSMLRPYCEKNGLFEQNSQVSMTTYLDHIVNSLSSKNNVFGMKALFDQLEPFLRLEAVKELLQTSKFIWLVRRDLVAQAVSMYIARVTNEWTSMNEKQNQEKENKSRRDDVQYDRDKINHFMEYLTQQNLKLLDFFAINQIDYLQVYYEDILVNPNQICQEICKFCDVEVEHEFSIDSASFKKQGNELNEKLATKFRQESSLNLSVQLQDTEINLREITIIK